MSSEFALLKGEGGAQRRVRGTERDYFIRYPSPAASRHPLPSGEGYAPKFSLVFILLVIFAACSRSSRGIHQISTSESGAYEASLAILPNGFASAWYDTRDGNPEIYFRVLDSKGIPKSNEFRVTNNRDQSYEADIAALNENVAIAWYEKSAEKRLRAKVGVWTSDGKLLWEKTISSPARNGRNTLVRVKGSDLFCAWIEDDGSNNAEVWAGWWNSDGQEVMGPVRLAPAGKTTWNLNAAIDAEGKAWVVFDATSGTRSSELFAVSVDGKRNDVVRLTANDGVASKYPDIGFSGGRVAITWFDERDGNAEVYLFVGGISEVTPEVESHSVRITNTPGASIGAYLAWNGAHLGLAWCDNSEGQHEIYFQTFDRSGKPLREAQQLTHNKTDSLIPAIKPFGGSFALVWNEYSPQTEDSHEGGKSEIAFSLAP